MAKNDLWEMKGLDIFLQSLSDVDREKYRNEVVPKSNLPSSNSLGLPVEFFKSKDLKSSEKIDNDTLLFMAAQFDWRDNITDIMINSYDALVVTDVSQKVIWTNQGFFNMTGYTPAFAIGKKPTFLQGPETSIETKLSIKKKLLEGISFTQNILNYKKNKEKYWCQIQIFPMKTETGITHFLALETEI